MLHDPREELLFPRLPSSLIDSIREVATERSFAPGETLFEQDVSPYDLYVILSGEVRITRRLNHTEMLLAIHGPGEFTGDIEILNCEKSNVTGVASSPSLVLHLTSSQFRRMIAACSYTTAELLKAMSARSRDFEAQLRHREKLAALETLAAGLAHELNNPASSISSAALSLGHAARDLESLLSGSSPSAPGFAALYTELRHCASQQRRSSIELIDEEAALHDELLRVTGLSAPHLAASFASAGFTLPRLRHLLQSSPPDAAINLLTWAELTLRIDELQQIVLSASRRVSTVVDSMRNFSHLDRAESASQHLHLGIELSLERLQFRLPPTVSITRQYSPTAPAIDIYPRELNQAWTAILENAIDAVGPTGNIHLTTGCDRDVVWGEIANDGPCIPADHLPHIFHPFFTTKPVGTALGMGLDTARRIVTQRHKGDIWVRSDSQWTAFRIALPRPNLN